MSERGIFTTFVTWSGSLHSCQVCHSRGLDTSDVDPEALVRWLADWVELSDAAGGKTCCCEKCRRFHGKCSATLGRQFARLRVFTFIDVARISCARQPPVYLFSCTRNWLQVFSRLQLVARFPTLTTGYMFSRVHNWWLHVFSRLQLVACFPAAVPGNVFLCPGCVGYLFMLRFKVTLYSFLLD